MALSVLRESLWPRRSAVGGLRRPTAAKEGWCGLPGTPGGERVWIGARQGCVGRVLSALPGLPDLADLLRLLSPRRGDGSSVWLGPAGLQTAHTHSLLETTRTAHNTSMAQEAKTHEMRLELTASPAVPTARDPAPAAPPPPALAAPLAQASVINSPKEVGRRRLPGLRRLVAGVRPQLITALPAGLRLLDRRRRPPLQRQPAQALHAGHPAGVSGRSCLTRAALQMRTGLWPEVGAFHTSSFLYLQTRVHNSLALHAGCTWGWASARARSPEARSLWRCGRSSPASSTSST